MCIVDTKWPMNSFHRDWWLLYVKMSAWLRRKTNATERTSNRENAFYYTLNSYTFTHVITKNSSNHRYNCFERTRNVTMFIQIYGVFQQTDITYGEIINLSLKNINLLLIYTLAPTQWFAPKHLITISSSINFLYWMITGTPFNLSLAKIDLIPARIRN